MACIYEVNITVRNEDVPAYRTWLDEHISKLLKIDGFVGADRYAAATEGERESRALLTTARDHQNGKRGNSAGLHSLRRQRRIGSACPELVVLYKLQSKEALDNYFAHYAAAMRDEGARQWGTTVSYTRRIMSFDGSHVR